ncbi:DNA mismatch repair protein MutS [Aureispira anguillae]|uniref:DNA mismatch repair protein MutS n=2 Tax=Aureispira anguillae TaxID=2864201 RepID=A0A915YH10_9BACT|nr:DNA mismatch repair protein MutS [Aureispira anguillae]BDS12877.1 DNA mismatch repair protein MutS [Aureispira anguillae]
MAKKKVTKARKQTPLMAQYEELKSKYSDAILLFRVGDFYETFSTDAITASNVLGIVLTARNNGSSKVELAGFPHHSLDTYLPKLVQAGYRVAVCDQLEKPSKLKKLVKRGVTEVVTPGVTINDKILDHKSNNYLAAIHFGKKGQFGLALLDISTGEFVVSEGTSTYIDKLLQSFQPSEIIFAKTRQKDILKHFGDKFYQYGIDDWVYSADYSQEKLLQQFEVASMKGFGIEALELAQIAAGSILHYVATTENTNLKHITTIARIQPDRYVWLDKFTVRNLELVHSPHASGVPLVNILDQTVSPMGTRLLKRWIILPLKDKNAVTARHQVVRHFIDNSEIAELVETQIRQIGDLERLISKVPLGKINPREVKQLERALIALEPIKAALETADNKQLQSIGERLQLCGIIRERIGRELVAEPPVKMDKGGVMADGISEELDELRDIIKNSKQHLLNIQQQEASSTGIDNLKIGFNNVFGYYLEVTNKYKNKGLVPDHWVRKQTLTNAERYITDDLKKLEVKILGAEEKILALENRLFQDLVFALTEYISPVQMNAALIAQLDCLASFAKVAIMNNYCRPQMNDSLEIDVKEGRHPVIEKQLKLGEEYVPNDIYLDNNGQQIIMITGPNMSGKSALLRQTALICLMAQMGSFVPAREAKLGMIDKVFTRVGASDNISSGESTFMVEMNETASILNNISERSLILLDEIGRGTSTYDGISIAWSIAEFLHNNTIATPKTLFATHYHELNELADRFPRIKNFNVATKELNHKVIFLRKLQEGGSKHSFGIHVAKMAGMPRYVVERANEILGQLEQKSIDAGNLDEKVKKIAAPAMQLSFFDAAPDPVLTELKEQLEEVDLNRLTPIECMLKLDELKKLLD